MTIVRMWEEARLLVTWVVRLASALLVAGCVTGSPPALEPETIPPAVEGRYYEVNFHATRGAGVQAEGVPSGLELASLRSDGLMFGVPPAAGTYTFTVTATTGGPTMFTDPPPPTTKTYTLMVEPSTGESGLLFVFDGEATFTANEPFAYDLREGVTGGQAPYRFGLYCIEQRNICAEPPEFHRPPPGASLSEEGVLSGTVAPSTGVSAFPMPRGYALVVCVVDATSARACDSVALQERLRPTPPPAAT